MVTNVTTDTFVMIKGLIPPRRRKKDPLYETQLDLHLRSRKIMSLIESGDYANHVPLLALVETACVAFRLTDDDESADLALSFVSQNSRLYSDAYLLDRSIGIGKRTKASGFDVIFMACAEETGSILITDDRKMYERANDYGLNVRFLRDL